MNQTGGLLGGIVLVLSIGAAVVVVSPDAKAWVVGVIKGVPSSSAPPAATPAPAAGAAGGGWGTVSAPIASSSPYQLTYNPASGVGISTAATIPINEMPAIPLPSIPPLAPTSSSFVYA